MTADQKFSPRKVLVTAIIGFLVSGLGGAALNEYLARAKPQVIINSVGFRFPSLALNIKVPDKLLTLAKRNPWQADLKGEMSIAMLREYRAHGGALMERLETAARISRAWIQDIELRGLLGQTKQLAAYDIREFPLLNSETLFALARGALRRGDLNDPPVPALELNQYEDQLSVTERGDDYWLDLGDYLIRFSPNPPIEHATPFYHSIQKGLLANLLFYQNRLLKIIGDDLTLFGQVRKELGDLLMPYSELAVKVTAVNRGRTSTILEPFFGLRLTVEGKEATFDSALIAASTDIESLELFESLDDLEEARGGSKRPYTYIVLGPNSSSEIDLSAVNYGVPEALSNLLQQGFVVAEIVGYLPESKVIRSEKFGVGSQFAVMRSHEVLNVLKK